MNKETEEIVSCPQCGNPLPPTAYKCEICGADLSQRVGLTLTENKELKIATSETDVPRPVPGELPSYHKKLDIALISVVIFIGIIANFYIFRLDRQEVITKWVDEAIRALESEDQKYWNEFSTHWPPEQPVNIVSAIEPVDGLYISIQDLVGALHIIKGEYDIRLPQESILEEFEHLRDSNSESHWLVITGMNSFLYFSFEISYWLPEFQYTPAFSYEKSGSLFLLYKRPLAHLFFLLLILGGVRFLLIEQYRRCRRQNYEAFEIRQTQAMFEANKQLDDARRLAESGQIAKALVMVNGVLKAMPGFNEARRFKQLLMRTQEAGTPTLTIPPNLLRETTSESATLLYLRVLGTPYAYLAPTHAKSISIGRQRRKIGEASYVGNDVVIRVPGSKAKSLCISRRHLEIQRIDTEYFVIDRSRGNTKLNGRILVPDQPVRLHSGDRLLIAGVLSLEVLIRVKISGRKTNNILNIEPNNEHNDFLFIEASLGDMLTEVADEPYRS